MGRDASLAGTCVLRPASGSPDRGRFRPVCRDGMTALLRAEDGRTVSAAGALFPDAHGWLFRGDCQKTRGRLPHEIHAKVFGWVLQLVGVSIPLSLAICVSISR